MKTNWVRVALYAVGSLLAAAGSVDSALDMDIVPAGLDVLLTGLGGLVLGYAKTPTALGDVRTR